MAMQCTTLMSLYLTAESASMLAGILEGHCLEFSPCWVASCWCGRLEPSHMVLH